MHGVFRKLLLLLFEKQSGFTFSKSVFDFGFLFEDNFLDRRLPLFQQKGGTTVYFPYLKTKRKNLMGE